MWIFLGIITIIIFTKFFWENPGTTIIWIIIGLIEILGVYLIIAGYLLNLNNIRGWDVALIITGIIINYSFYKLMKNLFTSKKEMTQNI